MGDNVEVLLERIDYLWYITFIDKEGKPLLIFSQSEASMTRIARSQTDKLQLLMRISMSYYILTFPNCDKAKEFNEAMAKYAVALYISRVEDNVKKSFENNKITVDLSAQVPTS